MTVCYTTLTVRTRTRPVFGIHSVEITGIVSSPDKRLLDSTAGKMGLSSAD